MQRSLLLGSDSVVCATIIMVTVLVLATEGKSHERTSDRDAIVGIEPRFRSEGLQMTSPILKFAQGEFSDRKFPDRGGDRGGGGGGFGGGLAIDISDLLALIRSVPTEIGYGALGALFIALAAGGGRWLRDRIKKPSLYASGQDVDVVECSVFGPRRARPCEEIMIAVFLHLGEQRRRASLLAKAMDMSAVLRARCSEIAIKRGATVEITCVVGTLQVDEPVQSLVWQGRLATCQFLIRLPERSDGQSFFAAVRVSVDGCLIGSVKFRISSEPNGASKGESLGSLRRYEKPFVSYATKDRKEVLKRVQMLHILKTQFFMDLLSLDPGERWERKLYKNIDRCDLFLLFWSQAAKDSSWVLREAEYALARQQKHAEWEPDIVPVILEGGILPPPILAQLNFNDQIHYLISEMDRTDAKDSLCGPR